MALLVPDKLLLSSLTLAVDRLYIHLSFVLDGQAFGVLGL